RTAHGRARELDVAHVPIRLLENDVDVTAVPPLAPVDRNRREIEDPKEAQGRVEVRLSELCDLGLHREGRSLVDRFPQLDGRLAGTRGAGSTLFPGDVNLTARAHGGNGALIEPGGVLGLDDRGGRPSGTAVGRSHELDLPRRRAEKWQPRVGDLERAGGRGRVAGDVLFV